MDIILATGGTGGHIFPAITLARALKIQGYNSTLFTDKKTDKNTDVESYTLPLCKPSSNKFKFFLFLICGCVLALYQIRKLKPKLVIGFGSYASFPTLLAAKILSIPIILHEQNTVLGRVNRFFSKSAKLIATSFPETKYARNSKCVFTGNFVDIKAQEPVIPIPYTQLCKHCNSEAILASGGVIQVADAQLCEHCGLSLPEGCHPSSLTLGSRKIDCKQAHYTTFSMKLPKNWIPVSSTGMTSGINILIIAGSQGANFFDDVVSDVICNLPTEMKEKIRVTQQCTKKNMDRVRGLYESERIYCELSEFFDDMENRLASAHLIISRAGATSIAEITLAERPAIYIPYPHSKDSHQFYNAKYIEDSGAAVIVEQNSEAKKNLRELLVDLLQNCQKLCDMANNTKETRIRNGVTEFIKVMAQEFS
ncbi:MAG: UDP-N-acetylglucosamine--N-acetylmuramyl-(pentapeptide) pyrophosphoryl-undecaprenol N-acetylglucosamine transferase [Rickettsiales bacterium]|jgi:undecaprenyldiphospho-muramoylpentapeptide beta-N-acetylglucosaminyltransferase|nr:UDP-N-acetylglucosamine--N-acetylmuramyl-(pentapeptide) pyrophosphoryl-undecaprenol N-acetylglucosamine transferase [Rickettsiales bacterium]MDR1261289.1 UDP-N-acetylglucosamine--N-acetylmuramyl-(pentapeptide) pyrophosphoryl-undecaprenol N-acetylglucosamine transferase [Rickettsiales bacterium]